MTILLENFAREYEIAESEYADISRMVKLFWDAMYLSRIQVRKFKWGEVIRNSGVLPWSGKGIACNAHYAHKDQRSIGDHKLQSPKKYVSLQKASPNVTDEILSSWEEFKKIFDEFDNDVDNDGPKLDDIGRVRTGIDTYN